MCIYLYINYTKCVYIYIQTIRNLYIFIYKLYKGTYCSSLLFNKNNWVQFETFKPVRIYILFVCFMIMIRLESSY